MDGPESGELSQLLSGLRLDQLIGEMQERLGEIVTARLRMQKLLDAVLVVGAGLELGATLERIVQAAVDLVDARYGALGVLDPEDGSISRFVEVGMDPQVRAGIPRTPEGKGLLGVLVEDPRPLRLADLTQHPASVGFPPGHPPMRSFLGVPIRVRDAVYGNIYLAEKVGASEFTADDEVVLQALAAAAGIAVQNSDLFEQSRVREHWLEASAEIRGAVLAGDDEASVLELVARRCTELAGIDGCLIALGPGTDDTFRTGAVVGGARPLADLDPALLRDAVETREPVHGCPSAPVVAVPMRISDQVTGVLVATRDRPERPFRAADTPLLVSFADQAALALELGEKNRAQSELAVLADRDRIARDLHDHVIQRLFAVGLKLQGTVRRSSEPEVTDRIGQALDELDHTVREIRTSIFDLHAAGAGGLRRLLLDAVAEVAAESGLSTEVATSGPVDTLVPPAVATHVLAVVREAAANTVRHAAAHTLTVSAQVADGDLTVEIVDDGRGVPAGPRRSGLRNLGERAEELGGEFAVGEPPSGGTRLVWRVPIG
ncbi:sensor histidine kinase [Pseudonocardia phyllosphaerae]|uniref:sensor histidine kinase n=1 Tax=Pseudonocardia phyllosphaerae TaxID=3390502 RepID=UPI00397E6182